MAEFVKGSKLNSEIEAIFENAQQTLVIISPYIKLHSRFIEILKTKKENPNLEIIIVFGKNEEDISKSINKSDIEFLIEFPNIEILHEPRLHAKYYSNEFSSVLSSMNLYDFSQNNNIEFGIVTKTTFLGNLTSNVGNTLDKDAFEYFKTIVNNSRCLYRKTPNFESKLMGLSKKYINSDVKIDNLSSFFGIEKNQTKNKQLKLDTKKIGYCIRTGNEIEFNIMMPLSEKAFKNWEKYSDENYPEKFCHFSGEPSNGETSFAKPILHKNWKKAQGR